MRKYLITGIFLVAGVIAARAQNIYGNQPTFTRQYLQPATMGFSDYAGVYLFQRNEEVVNDVGFSTTLMSLQMPIFSAKSDAKLGVAGVTVMRDASNGGGFPLRHIAVEGTYAYAQPIAKGHSVAASAGFGYHGLRLGVDGLSTASQWVQYLGIDESLPTGENLPSARVGYMSVNAGLGYQWLNDEGQKLVETGFSAFGVNRPNESFFPGASSQLPVRWAWWASVRAYQAGNWGFYPQVYTDYRGGAWLLNAGLAVDMAIHNDNPLDPVQDGVLRLAARYSQAQILALALQFDQPQYQLAFSFDLGFGATRTYQQATEIGLSYRRNLRPRTQNTEDLDAE